MDTRRMHVVLPCELVDLAHQAAGATLSTSELIRLGLAHLAGVEPDAYEVKQGRPVEPASS